LCFVFEREGVYESEKERENVCMSENGLWAWICVHEYVCVYVCVCGVINWCCIKGVYVKAIYYHPILKQGLSFPERLHYTCITRSIRLGCKMLEVSYN